MPEQTAAKYLDYHCFNRGFSIPDKDKYETIINNSLGVLLENGLFGMFVYLFSYKKEKEFAKKVREEILKLLINEPVKILNTTETPEVLAGDFNKLKAVLMENMQDIDQKIFAEELVEKCLIYARYTAKSKKKESLGENS